jgi:hypothetical protein
MIVCCPLPDSKLFIYLKSGCADTDSNSIINKKTQVQVTICTNSIAGCLWEESNSETLKQCTAICERHGGEFIYNPANKTGVLFTLNLPGKLNITTLG